MGGGRKGEHNLFNFVLHLPFNIIYVLSHLSISPLQAFLPSKCLNKCEVLNSHMENKDGREKIIEHPCTTGSGIAFCSVSFC